MRGDANPLSALSSTAWLRSLRDTSQWNCSCFMALLLKGGSVGCESLVSPTQKTVCSHMQNQKESMNQGRTAHVFSQISVLICI